MKLKDIILEYIEDYKYQIKAHTYWIYYKIAKRMSDDIVIQSETPKNYLNEWLCDKKLSYSSKKMLKSLINRSLDFANQSGLLCYPHKITLRLKKDCIRKVVALKKEDQQKLESYILKKKNCYYYGIIICLYTGLRIGELLSLKWEDVDFEKNMINVKSTISVANGKEFVDSPKTYSSFRQIPIASTLVPILKKLQKQKSVFVIKGKNMQSVSPKSYRKSFCSLLEKLCIAHYNFHSLRHTFASRLMENKIDVKTISELMGHNSANITLNTYVHSNVNQKASAISILCA